MSEGPRAIALRVVRRVVEQGAYSNLALAAALGRSSLPAVERALAAELAYGTLRKLRPLDTAIAQRASRPISRITPGALAALRLGTYQILFTRIPAHAAVGETVALVGKRERGFVNAVLRSLAAEPPQWSQGGDPEAIEARTSLSAWAVRELRRLLPGEAESAATALAARAPLTLRVERSQISLEGLERAFRDAGISASRGEIHPGSLLVEATVPSELPGFRDGWFAVQDQASSFVAVAVEAAHGHRVLDACAGPGGKATHLASLVGPEGVVVAADAAPKRAGLVRAAARRLGQGVRVLAQDARRPALRPVFDRVLVDAPCSGIGSARRRPELLWRPREEDLPELGRLQVEIVSSAADLLATGGRLVYSVCTFPRAETDSVCDELLRMRPGLAPAEIEGPDGREPRVRLWPHRHGTDAMFIAAFRRA